MAEMPKTVYYVVELNKTYLGYEELCESLSGYLDMKPHTLRNYMQKVTTHQALNIRGLTTLKFPPRTVISDKVVKDALRAHYDTFRAISEDWNGLSTDRKFQSWVIDSLYCPETCRRYRTLSEAAVDISVNDSNEEITHTYKRLLRMMDIQYRTQMVVEFMGYHLLTKKMFDKTVKAGVKYLNEMSTHMSYREPEEGKDEFILPVVDRMKETPEPNPLLVEGILPMPDWDVPYELRPYRYAYMGRIYDEAGDMLTCHPDGKIYIDDAWKSDNLHCTASVKCAVCDKEVFLPISAKEFYRIDHSILGKAVERERIEDPYA